MHFSRSAMKSAWFHGWNLPDFMKSTRFHHEICQISPWNLPDFMNSGFCCIFLQNQYRYTWMSLLHAKYVVYISPFMKSTRFHGLPLDAVFFSFMRSNTDINVMYKSLPYHWFHLAMKSARFNEIRRISWNPPDFMVFAKWAKDQWSYFFLFVWLGYTNWIFRSAIWKKNKHAWWWNVLLSTTIFLCRVTFASYHFDKPSDRIVKRLLCNCIVRNRTN